MRILFEVTHPKHVHLFRNAVRALEARGHIVCIAAREKDVTVPLLRAYGLPCEVLSRHGVGLFGLVRELVVRDWRLLRLARRFRPDILVARVSPASAHVGALLRRPVVMFDDTEHATLQQKLTFPFVTRICTARHYEKNWGARHVRYRSFDELAYLHPSRFTPDPEVVGEAGLKPEIPYIVVRFVSWRAAHDVGQAGISASGRLRLIRRLERFGRVVVSSEAPMPKELERYRLAIPPHKFHHLLAFARLYLGEGATVATEAALLGVPAIFVSTLRAGSLNRLEHHYGLAFSVSAEEEALSIAERLLADPATPGHWRCRRERLLAEEEDLTDWMVRFIDDLAARRKETPAPRSQIASPCGDGGDGP